MDAIIGFMVFLCICISIWAIYKIFNTNTKTNDDEKKEEERTTKFPKNGKNYEFDKLF